MAQQQLQQQLGQALKAAVEQGDANATAWLEHQRDMNFAAFMPALCVELGTKDRPIAMRQLAGLQIKNAVDTKNDQARELLHQRWKALPSDVRSHVKTMLLAILGDETKDVRHTAAMAIGKIGAIEVPAGTWPDLFSTLDGNITKMKNPYLKESSLEALGFVCEDSETGLEAASNMILGAIAAGIDPSETNMDIKLAATRCLFNSMDFIKANMESEADRPKIMNMVFSVLPTPNEHVRIVGFSCLVSIASTYYQYLGPFMARIFGDTTNAIATQTDSVAKQAIEFWSTVADVELECMEEDKHSHGDASYKSRSLGFIKAAAGPLVPILLTSLTKQDPDQEDGDWNVSIAAATCLGLCSQVGQNVIPPLVLPFIEKNVRNPEWRLRDASILAFGCILDGPDTTELARVVKMAFGMILGCMKDPHPMVKDTTAWTIGRICSLIPEVVEPATLPSLVDALIEGLKEPPKVASNVCWAIHNLASSVDYDGNSSPLSPYFTRTLQGLLAASVRSDVKESHLQVSVFESINVMIHTAAPDVHPLIAEILPIIIQKLQLALSLKPQSKDEVDAMNEIQALLCGSLQAIVDKLGEDKILPHADTLMTLYLTALQSKDAQVHEEAFLGIGTVAHKVKQHFVKYMEALKPFLITGLKNVLERECKVAVQTVCDVAPAVGVQFCAWGDEVMKILLTNVANGAVRLDVKALIITCMGDIATAIGPNFERYLGFVANCLMEASKTRCDPDDYDNLDDVVALREAILDSYSSVLLGLGAGNESKVATFYQCQGLIGSILEFFDLLGDPKEKDNLTPRMLGAACGLMFDLAKTFGTTVITALRRPSVKILCDFAIHEDQEPPTRLNSQEASKLIFS